MFRFVTIHEPSRSLSASEQASLCAELLALNLSLSEHESFQRNWHARIGSLMSDTDLLCLAYQGDEMVGHYSSLQLTGPRFDVTYVDTLTVHPRLQRSGLATQLGIRMAWHGLRRNRGSGFVLASRTEAPHVAASICAAVGQDNCYPNFTGDVPDPGLATIARALARHKWPTLRFSSATGVLEASYGGRFLPTMPTHYALVQEYFEQHVDPERGDALLQVFCLPRDAWLHITRQIFSRLLRVALRKRRRQD